MYKAVMTSLVLGLISSALAVRPSAGCSSETPDQLEQSVVLDGTQRAFEAFYPLSASPKPIVFIFHGRTVRDVSFIDFSAEAREIVQVYPQGLFVGGGYSWWNPGDKSGQLRDYALFDRLLELHARHLCLDLNRVYVVGYSLGASFASSLGCARAGVVRAVAVLGGGIQEPRCARPVAAMVLHHPRDALVSIREGERTREVFLRSTGIKLSSAVFPSAAQTLSGEDWSGFRCQSSSGSLRFPVVWCPHQFDIPVWGGPVYTHGWPAHTNRLIWKFLSGLP